MTEMMGIGDHGEETAFEPAYQAHRLRLSGLNWREVAKRTGYLNETACRLGVKQYLDKAALALSNEQRQHALALQLERLDELLLAWWAQAHVDDKAANVALRIIAQMGKYQKLEEPSKDDGQHGQTIVVVGGSKDYTEQLKIIAGHVPSSEGESE